jgi:hypothetical protein
MRPLHLLLALTLAACGDADAAGGGVPTGGAGGAGGVDTNADGDCLEDAEEAELGTDPAKADTDGDGFDDCAEIDCVSDPLDPKQPCYVCGWPHNDPGTLVATGAAEGDVIANLELVDQCQESVRVWDFAGEYHLLFMTAAW